MNPKEIELIHNCYKTRYKSLDCLECEMNYLCEAWKRRDGVAPLTLHSIEPTAKLNSDVNPGFTARQVA